jgi:hypothetical protein
MFRLVFAPLIAVMFFASSVLADSDTPRTQWVVRGAEGLDAILLIGAASGDVLQARHYPDEIAWVREHLSEEGLAALALLDQWIRVEGRALTGPRLALIFSAGPFATLDDIIASARDPETHLRATYEASPFWRGEQVWEGILRLMPTVLAAFEALKEAGFEKWYAENHAADVAAGVDRNRAVVAPHDIIPEQQRLLGRPLNPVIEVVVLQFSKPYGIRVIGQRFLTHHSYDAGVQLRTAVHEIFHPPFDLDDAEMWERLRALRDDPWMISIVEDHDPSVGYNSFEGVVDEGSAQALDQIVSERLGFARDPGERWRTADGGMHMLAAALYHAIKEDGIDERGGVYGDWLKSALDRGLLTPEEVKRRAAEIVGEEAVAAWGPHRRAAQ